MSADARLLNFRQFVGLVAPEVKRLFDSRPHRLAIPSDIENELSEYAKAVYHHKVARKRMLAEGRITEL